MKKFFLLFTLAFAITVFTNEVAAQWNRVGSSVSLNNNSWNVGIGTSSPENKLHVSKGSAGAVVGHSEAPLIVENSTHSYINILAPNSSETGILFGKPQSFVSGGIIYSNPSTVNGLQFRTNGNNTRMVLTANGNLGIGTLNPNNKLQVSKGSAGVVGHSEAPLIVENSTHSYINILAPNSSETGILFGKPQSFVSGGIIYSNPSTVNGLQFRTNGNNTRMVLTANGNLGINTLTPEPFKTKIVHGGFGLNLENAATGNDWEILASGSSATGPLSLFCNGTFVGSFNCSNGNYSSISDVRLKKNIHPMPKILEKINQLKPYTYQFKDCKSCGNDEIYNGFLAQDVIKVFPTMVTRNVNKERNLDVYTMDYNGFGVIAVKGIQELQTIIEDQKQKIMSLEDRLAKLEASFVSVLADKKNANSIYNKSEALLGKAMPNPSNEGITIRYSIPENMEDGEMVITDITGKVIRTYSATKGASQIYIRRGDLPAANYNYTLIVNGNKISTKQLIITR